MLPGGFLNRNSGELLLPAAELPAVFSRMLTGLVEFLGRLSSPLQPGGIEVAPFVLGFISTATGASGRRWWWWWWLRREARGYFRLPLIQTEQPRHFKKD